ncbi:MAG: hypothetical protein WA687_02710 [Solirubrobacterales bacterium]
MTPLRPSDESATLTLSHKETDTILKLLTYRLFTLGMLPAHQARQEGVTVLQLLQERREDAQLLRPFGWGEPKAREAYDLTMPAESIAKTLKRLREDARRGPSEWRYHLRTETDAQRRKRFRRAEKTCDKLLERLEGTAAASRWSQ